MAEPADDKDNRNKLAPVGALFVGMVAAKNLARRGDDRPLRAMEHAEKLRRSGAGESQIYAETNKLLEGSPYAGVSYGADRKPRFEISDHSSELRTAALDSKGKGLQGNFLKHPTYYDAHPDAAMLDLFKHGSGGGGYGGNAVFIGDSHFAQTKLLGRPVANPTARGVNLHELQHHAQGVEGFAPGGSPKDFEKKFPGERNANVRRALYDTLAGEVEAENTRNRANMTPAERRAIHPTKTASIPRSDQIVTDRHGNVQEIFDPKSITVAKFNTGAAIKFDYDRDTVADFKKQFPKAKWSQDTKTWHVPGKLAGNRADRWVAAQHDTAGKLAKADAIARDAAAFDGAPTSRYVNATPQGYRVSTGYDPEIVKTLKSIPGSSFEPSLKTWMVPHRSAEALKGALKTIEPIADKARAEAAAKEAKLNADRDAQRKQWAAQKVAATSARDAEMAKVRASRFAVHSGQDIKVGDAVMHMGKVAVVESFGRQFRVDESFPSTQGSQWLGREGETARYAYTREATPAEASAFETKTAAEKAESARRNELYSAAKTAKSSIDAKFAKAVTPKRPLGQVPQGTTLAHFSKQNAIYGGGVEYRLSQDGKSIWRIQGNGADGDYFGANNAPGSIVSKVRATKDAVAKLKALGEVESAGLRGTQNLENLKAILASRTKAEKPPLQEPHGVNTRLVTITKPTEPAYMSPAEIGERYRQAYGDGTPKQGSTAMSERQGWSDAAREASAEVRAANAKPKPAQTVQSAVERAMAMQEAKLKAPQQSTLGAPKPADKATPASMSGSGSKRYVTLGDGRKVGLGQYTNAWKRAKALPSTAEVRGAPGSADRGDVTTAKQAVEQFRAGVHDRINQKMPGFQQGRKWDDTWQNDARRLAETMKMKAEVPAGQAHPVDLRPKVADRLAPDTKLPPKGGTGIKGKVMGLMAPVAIGSAALIAMNESAKAGETTGQQVKAGSIEAVKGGAVMGGFVAGTIAITKGLTKAGLTAAKAVPATQAILMAGGAIHGAVTAKPGERMKGAAKGAWDMSVPGMVVNTYEAGKAAYHSTADRLSSPSRMTTEQAQHFNQANAAYKADHQSGPITVEQFERTRRLPSGQVVTEHVEAHTRVRRD